MRRGWTRAMPRIAPYDRHRVGAFKRVRGRPLVDHRGGPHLIVPLRKHRRKIVDPYLAAYRKAARILGKAKGEGDAEQE